MNKKVWSVPSATIEKFVANEYVAACTDWGVGCNTLEANRIEAKLNNRPAMGHQQKYCGQKSHQFIVRDANNIPLHMQEEKSGFGNTLYCTIYDENFTEKQDIKKIKPGDTIYWTTSFGRNVYHHVGKVYGEARS